MGLDGFSMSNLGLHRNLTTAQMANDAERTANQALENQILDVDGVSKKEKAGKKDSDAAFAGMVPFIAEEEKKDEEENLPQEESSQQTNPSNEEQENDEPKYKFKLNAENIIEVWDNKTNSIIRTLTPEEAINSVQSFSKLPSLLFDKDV